MRFYPLLLNDRKKLLPPLILHGIYAIREKQIQAGVGTNWRVFNYR